MKLPPVAPAPSLESAAVFVRRALEEGAFPGAQVAVAREGEIVWHEAFGLAAREPMARAMDVATLLDIASLTKPLSTAALVALLVQEKRIDLTDTLGDHLPYVRGTDKAGITIAALLAHESGLPAYVPYYRELADDLDPTALPAKVMHQAIVTRILREPCAYRMGSEQRYSDFDFILLGELVAHLLGVSLDTAFSQRIAGPLGVAAAFHPIAQMDSGRQVAATERCPWRGEVLQGVVHDDHAWLMGGVAGHAGLFASAGDVLTLADAWLRAWHGEQTIFEPAVVQRFWQRVHPDDAARTWALGWDTPTPGASTAGKWFSPRSFGHLGFTGTSVWIDAERRIIVVLLTNRIHPTRENEGIRAFRPAFHDLVMEALLNG